MRILVTGASGLLGGCIYRALSKAHEVTGTYQARPFDSLVPLDITDRDAVLRLVRDGGFSHIVGNAALRSPEYCLAHSGEAYRVNALGVEHLAEAAQDTGAMLVQISTDYVFPGEAPPYREDDPPRPVNLYGRTKLAGEHAARRAPRWMILRVPALWRTDLADPRNVASEYAAWIRKGESRTLDDEIVRYYTLADDVAAALVFLLEAGAEGLFQVTAEQKTTKADFARRLCAALGADPAQVISGPTPAAGDARPFDSHLDASRYRAMGGPSFSDIDAALRHLSA